MGATIPIGTPCAKRSFGDTVFMGGRDNSPAMTMLVSAACEFFLALALSPQSKVLVGIRSAFCCRPTVDSRRIRNKKKGPVARALA